MLLIQEYQDEISTLTADLTSARDQNGVFMSKEKYQALMDQMNRQKIAIDQEKVQTERWNIYNSLNINLLQIHPDLD